MAPDARGSMDRHGLSEEELAAWVRDYLGHRGMRVGRHHEYRLMAPRIEQFPFRATSALRPTPRRRGAPLYPPVTVIVL